MYAITEGVAKINGEIVDTFEREISDGRTALEVEAGTTGFVGEDCRNAGGRTYIGINCICGDFYFEPVKNDNGQISGIKIACCGDDGQSNGNYFINGKGSGYQPGSHTAQCR